MPTTEATKEDFDREVDRALASWKQLGGRATRLGRELTLCMQMVAAGSLDAAVTVQASDIRSWEEVQRVGEDEAVKQGTA